MNYYLFCPSKVNLYHLKSVRNYILMVYRSKYFWFAISGNSFLTCSAEFNIISIKAITNSGLFKQHLIALNYFIFSWVSFISKKIKFKHKGAWVNVISSKLRVLILNFRLAHLAYLFNQRVLIRRRKKHFSFHTLLYLGYSTKSLLTMGTSVYRFFKLNKFTFRGIRFSRQRLIKKEGKVSKYMIDLKK